MKRTLLSLLVFAGVLLALHSLLGCRASRKEKSRTDSTAITTAVQTKTWADESLEELTIEADGLATVSQLLPQILPDMIGSVDVPVWRKDSAGSKPVRARLIIRKARKEAGQLAEAKTQQIKATARSEIKIPPPVGFPFTWKDLLILFLVLALIVQYFINKHS